MMEANWMDAQVITEVKDVVLDVPLAELIG